MHKRIGVYTATDYANILRDLVIEWDIEHLSGLNGNWRKIRDYLVKLRIDCYKNFGANV